MRVLVVFAHPVETSFASGVHAKLVAVLRAKGHKVDDCDLNIEGFDPVMSRQDRIDYHNVAVNRRGVSALARRREGGQRWRSSIGSGKVDWR